MTEYLARSLQRPAWQLRFPRERSSLRARSVESQLSPGGSAARAALGGLAWFSAGGHIGYVDASGKERLFKPLYAPTSMTAAPDGDLWFVNRHANLISRITPQGTVSRFSTTFGDPPGDIAVGPDGNLWVCGTTKIVRIT